MTSFSIFIASRLVASRVNLALCKISVEKDDCTPLWVVCDGKDPQGTFFIGLHRVGDLVSRTLVTSAGPYVGCEELPSLDHLKIHHTSTFPTKMVESTVTATYDILSGEDSERSSIRLTCAWKRPLTLLTPPAPNASTEANIVIVPSDQRSAADAQELSVLRGFVAGLSTGEVAWFVREGDKTVAEQIEDVFASVREKGQRQKKDEEASADCDKKVEEKFFSRRQNMDFIDLLWMVLMKCESYQELKESLEFIFKAVVMGQVRPQIHVRNNTQVGNLVRSLMRGQADLPELTGLMPLNMLIEMGIEKIKKDYINIFQAGDLATGEQLSWFVGYTDCMEDSVMQLEKLHVALQVVVLLHTYLNLPSSALVQFTAQALNQLKEGLSSPYSFSFKLSTFTVHQLLNSLKPSMWELVLHSTHSTLEKTLVCHVSHRPLIQMPNAHNDLEESAADCDKEEPEGFEERHFCTFITTVTDKILT
nr:protein zwilch homolog [Penaeus vannamei]